MSDQTVIPPARRQRPTMIRNLIPRLPERGHIKAGELGETRQAQSGRKYQLPQKLSFFKITTLERGKDGNFVTDHVLHEKLGLGPEPTEIPVRLLYDDIDLNFPTRYGCYLGTVLWCSGDGESATRLSKNPGEPPLKEPLIVPCTCERQDPGYQGAKDKCKINGRLSVLIEGAGGVGGVWVLRTTSYNSVTGILSSLAFLRSVTGGILANIPLVLRIQPKQATNPVDHTPVLIYVISLEFAGDISELQQMAHQIALDRATTKISIEHIEDEARRQLALPGPDNALLPGDNAEDVVAEFFPEQVEEPEPRPTREQFVEGAPTEDKKTPDPTPAKPARAAKGAAKKDTPQASTVAAPEPTKEAQASSSAGTGQTATTPASPSEDADTGIAEAEDDDEIVLYPVIDFDGVVTEYESAPEVEEAVLALLSEAAKRGMAAMTGLAESNPEITNMLRQRGHAVIGDGLDAKFNEIIADLEKKATPAAEPEPVAEPTSGDVAEHMADEEVRQAEQDAKPKTRASTLGLWENKVYTIPVPMREGARAINFQGLRDELIRFVGDAPTAAALDKFLAENDTGTRKLREAYPKYYGILETKIAEVRKELT